ncbi:hypothetical protein C7M61_002983 [Candidozyma pseudohaemuli]|uniref:CFEM domain-containing protein n=1 Tax=Candidozyma pseudohaemuli TaxID=418784 RepID=A0A2P7YR26_9ASCO|nr:hypothetical protein C7M61_002983 [[Candida] pseudohaemulonii]PSK38420.1 hypothetical protein C7M61_002983 [[Candida] pseudohaemulonii]
MKLTNALTVFSLLGSVFAVNQWSTYPSVPKTATYNGFADPIYDDLPECAKSCVELSTRSTPCPYWDTGCLCVMPQWSGLVAQCIVEGCRNTEVASATSLAMSLCIKVGANAWIMPSSVSDMLSLAAGTAYSAPSTTPDSPWTESSVLLSVMATARTEDKTRSGGPTDSSSSNGAAAQGAGVALLLALGALLT